MEKNKKAKPGTPAGFLAGLGGKGIKSKGKGQGKGYGKGKGPIGVPIKKKK